MLKSLLIPSKIVTVIFLSPYITPSATFRSFHHLVTPFNGFQIQAGYKVLATTQNSETFAVIADAMDWKYPS